jgi:hypothetical protein
MYDPFYPTDYGSYERKVSTCNGSVIVRHYHTAQLLVQWKDSDCYNHSITGIIRTQEIDCYVQNLEYQILIKRLYQRDLELVTVINKISDENTLLRKVMSEYSFSLFGTKFNIEWMDRDCLQRLIRYFSIDSLRAIYGMSQENYSQTKHKRFYQFISYYHFIYKNK